MTAAIRIHISRIKMPGGKVNWSEGWSGKLEV